MEIILKYFIHIPFIGNFVDFVIGGYKAGKEFFSVELCMECTDLLVFCIGAGSLSGSSVSHVIVSVFSEDIFSHDLFQKVLRVFSA
ncbi:hypothetical protein [Ruminococcus sp. SR1/5]|uniref:hypothetical protein n=1 Tax=Ruminococcus sp. SR1/5 TaxID=657323 RepID=UPI0001CD6169|nr:hypothetical protein [Ruminococcus sp. SR1/5]CBL18986.1 hypothetical protein CK1_07240 [Ruminococcus sp. SR1/5]